MLAFGIMKVAGWSAWMAQYWAAATDLLPFLGFLSAVAWGWIATIGEIIAWLFLLSGCRILSKAWAILALVIMAFASTQWIMPPWIVVVLWSLVVLTQWPWARKLCGKWCPCNKCSWGSCACDKNDGSCGCDAWWCSDGSCEIPTWGKKKKNK